jgi:hypothetical protein
MANGLVYHHTPVLPMMEPSPWVVLEYGLPNKRKDVAGVFRTSQFGDSTYKFILRGIDFSKSYTVHFENSVQAVEMTGAQLLQNGIPVRLDDSLTSELILMEQK